VLANDSDPDGDSLTVTAVTQGTKGSVAIAGGGASVTYTPLSRLWGSDSFTYTISDGHAHTATGTVNVTINQVDETVTADGGSTYGPHYSLQDVGYWINIFDDVWVWSDLGFMVIDDRDSSVVFFNNGPAPACNSLEGWASGIWNSGCAFYKDLTP
jgi:Bacterial Ig domain